MGLETHTLASLWKDRAVTEINVAVLHSFQVFQESCGWVEALVRKSLCLATYLVLDIPLTALFIHSGMQSSFSNPGNSFAPSLPVPALEHCVWLCFHCSRMSLGDCSSLSQLQGLLLCPILLTEHK